MKFLAPLTDFYRVMVEIRELLRDVHYETSELRNEIRQYLDYPVTVRVEKERTRY